MAGEPPQEFADAERRHLEATPRSRALFERARRVLPGGVGRASIPYFHHPIFIERAEGAYLHDADGRALLDMWNGASSLPLGHGHPHVMATVRDQLGNGLGFCAPAEPEVRLAELLVERVPAIEQVRFTSSGTEATMFAIRLARAFTGRKLVLRMGNSYHGTHDMLMSGAGASLGGTWLGHNEDPVSSGVLPDVRDGVLFAPYNDAAACIAVAEPRAEDLAAIIVEPFLGAGGGLPVVPGYLEALRDLANRTGALLIFDEMISIGMSAGGGGAYYGIKPDLVTTGKLIGGGMPIGAFGGRADVMAMLEPKSGVPPVLHTGTWNGHPLPMAAGIATLEALDASAYAYLSHLGEHFRAAVRSLVARMGLAVQVTGICHYSAFHFTERPVTTVADSATSDPEVARRLHFALATHGFWMWGARSNLSAAITEADIARYIAALEIAFVEAGVAAVKGKVPV